MLAKAQNTDYGLAWLESRISQTKFARSTSTSIPITPELAVLMLARNTGNRKISKLAVTTLAEAIKRGEWIETHASIAFDRNGSLLDGQHRLSAVIEAGLPICIDVSFGIDPSSFDRIDTGKPRSTANLLEIGDVKSSVLVAAIARTLMAIELKQLRLGRSTSHQVIEYVKAHPDINEIVRLTENIRSGIGKTTSTSGLGAALYLIVRRMGTDADMFFEKLRTGVNMKSQNDPALVLRTKLGNYVGRHLTQVEVAAIVIKAFNAWLEGRTVSRLVWISSDEEFPKVGE
jgi:hypothetical protein